MVIIISKITDKECKIKSSMDGIFKVMEFLEQHPFKYTIGSLKDTSNLSFDKSDFENFLRYHYIFRLKGGCGLYEYNGERREIALNGNGISELHKLRSQRNQIRLIEKQTNLSEKQTEIFNQQSKTYKYLFLITLLLGLVAVFQIFSEMPPSPIITAIRNSLIGLIIIVLVSIGLSLCFPNLIERIIPFNQ